MAVPAWLALAASVKSYLQSTTVGRTKTAGYDTRTACETLSVAKLVNDDDLDI